MATLPLTTHATAPRRPRIDTISIQNFRGFPGTGNPAIKLGGKNLLIYGENGSGKSSIFYALDQFFSISETEPFTRRKLLSDQANIYSGIGTVNTSVTVDFVGGNSFAWTENSHPADANVQEVVEAAYRKAMLDYRSLLAVNYKFLGSSINLFEAFVNVLLRDKKASFGGGEAELHRIWVNALAEFGKSHTASRRDSIDQNLKAVNVAIDGMLLPLKDETNRLLKALKWDDLEVGEFAFSHLSCDWNAPSAKRNISGQNISFTLRQRGIEIDAPHHFLNEARQSGLAIALYLAGRRVMTANTQASTPNLMVLDDVLIGLDQSNRLPVLNLLKTDFSDWQIILLTHDRVWFEMARAHLPTADWAGLEIFEGIDAAGLTHPVPRPLNNFNAVLGNIHTARDFLIANHEKASAVHARMAFEQVLKKFCSRKGVPVAFKDDPKHLTTAGLLEGIKKWLHEPRHTAQQIALQPAIVGVEAARNVVLNAFSHSTPVTLAKAEIDAAITAVETLHTELNAQFP